MFLKIISFCLLTAFFFYACKGPESPAPEYKALSKRTVVLDSIQNGDFVVKQGIGLLSRSIVRKLHERVPFSHCGIVYKQGDSLAIVHAVAKELTGKDGVQTMSVDEFLSDCLSGYLYVVRIKDRSVAKQVPAIAASYLSKQTPFDYTIDYEDTSKVNCSEFVYQVCKQAGKKHYFSTIKIENKEVLAFNSLIDSANFDIIYHY